MHGCAELFAAIQCCVKTKDCWSLLRDFLIGICYLEGVVVFESVCGFCVLRFVSGVVGYCMEVGGCEIFSIVILFSVQQACDTRFMWITCVSMHSNILFVQSFLAVTAQAK